MLTLENVSSALPAHLKKNATQELVDKINTAVLDPEHAQTIRDNFLSYTRVLQDGKFKLEDYLNAIKYVSYKLMGCTNQDAYARAFPDRYQELVGRGETPKTIAAYVSMYNAGKLVNLILEQSLIPTWILNQDLYQKALNVQAELMKDANSEMVRTTAANSILQHLAKPKEVAQAQLNINLGETSGLNELKETLGRLAQTQKELIEKQGVSPKQIAAQAIIEVKNEP